ncbi:MAG TPA: right-handed parallel beta-helix repeat-containing protein, partial [Cellvibrionaceae bacterium]
MLSVSFSDSDGSVSTVDLQGIGFYTLMDQTAGSATFHLHPTDADLGEHLVSLTVTDNDGQSTSTTFTLMVLTPEEADCGCDHVINTWGPFNAADFTYSAGDVFCLEAGNHYNWIRFIGFNGTQAEPLRFKNCNGKVEINSHPYPGLEFRDSIHLIIDGTGSAAHTYGIKVASSNTAGISLTFKTSDVEVHNVEVTNTGFAMIMAKTDPNCDNVDAWRGNFLMKNMIFHDNYLHDNIDGEGFYLGYTGNYELGKQVNCSGGGNMVVHGHLLSNIKVYDNIIENVAWDAIQVSLAEGGSEIYNNVITNYGTNNEPVQNSGIAIGSGTRARVFNNTVINGPGHGVVNHGLGPVYFYNNIIVDAATRGIYNDRQKTPNSNDGYYFANNTIINAGGHGIFYNWQENTQAPFEAYNNIIVNPGQYYHYAALASHWTVPEEDGYIGFITPEAKAHAIKANNLLTLDIAEVLFTAPASNNYRLQSGSPAIDAGTDSVEALMGFDDDITGFNRVNDFDI